MRLNIRLGPITLLFSKPGDQYCMSCYTSWKYVIPHVTHYDTVKFCSVLCEKCWQELDVPGDRLKYYLDYWNRHIKNADDWPMICETVLRGG